jgi:adenylate cyclase
MGRFFRRYDVIATVLLFLAAIPAMHYEWLALIEDQTISARQQLRMSRNADQAMAISRDIVLVNTDEKFFKAYRSFPLRRTDIGAVAANLRALGAKVVAIDMLMDFPSSYGEDPVLAETLRAAGNTLLVSQGDVVNGRMARINYPTDTLEQASRSAYTNISSSNRWVTSLSRLKIYPDATKMKDGWPFSVLAAAMYLGVEPKLEDGALKLGDLTVPLDENGHFYIDYLALPKGTHFLSQSAGMSALEFLDISQLDDNDREELSTWVRDKIVLLGDTSEVSHDWFDTPVGSVYGVEVIANSIHSILAGAPLQPVPASAANGAALIILVLMAALTLRLPVPWQRSLALLAVLGGFGAVSAWLYAAKGMIMPMSPIMVAILVSYLTIEFYHYMRERDQKQMIARTFGQYIPTELVDEMSKTGQQVSVGGESREMTVLFSDVRGFTTISEGLSPNDLTRLMNAFLSPMTHVIHQNRGTIDKYMGDAIMAFWGAPLRDEDHARHAVVAALKMVQTMHDLGEDFTARGWKPLKVGIGLNTGTMNVGNMGSDFRLAYTVLGDAVNLGSRIESLTKQYGVDVMISEYTREALPDLICREVDLVRVKGKDTPVRLFEPLGFDGDVDTVTQARLDRHHAALTAFRTQHWDDAEAAFRALAEEEPDRKLYHVYLERIEHYREDAPGDDWDGVYTHKEK